MEKRLVFEDSQGRVIRSFHWNGDKLKVVRRGDTKRLSLVTSTRELEEKKLKFESLGEISLDQLSTNKPFFVGELGHLKLIESIEVTDKNLAAPKDRKNIERATYGIALLMALGLFGLVATAPSSTPKIEEELKQQVVKIVKKIESKKEVTPVAMNVPKESSTVKAKKPANLKRVGALAALGSLSKSSQRAGLNLGAVNTTAGPGLGGTQGSGGVQTSIYAKGIVGAPLGAGGNIRGAGGYGTKGKGGGQAGYGQLSLVGAAGTSPIPLGSEASVDGGLDRDQIAAVIQKNLGQVRFCYEQGLQSDSSLSGRVAVDFTIDGQGIVKEASVGNTTLHSKTVEDCLLLRLKTWRFPLPQGGVMVKVSYPFMLKRAGQG